MRADLALLGLRLTKAQAIADARATNFTPLGPPRAGKRSAHVGWITDANGCDIWQGARMSGYGVVTIAQRHQLVHRVRYEREVGPIPEGAELDHYVCDNGAGGCCNPFHCRPVTHRENTLRSRSMASVHAAKTHCPKGHPLTGDNLDRYELARGGRMCRICHNSRAREYRRAKKVANRHAKRAVA